MFRALFPRLVLVATFTLFGLALSAAQISAAAPPRPQEPSSPYPYTVQEITFENEDSGIVLAGTRTIPPGDGPFPGVVLVSGAGPQDRDGSLLGHRPLWVLADHLTRRGIAVLRFDDRGVGGSTGNPATTTAEDIAQDIQAGIDHLAAHPAVEGDAVGILAHSQGALAAMLAASKNGSAAFLIVLGSPGISGQTSLEQEIAALPETTSPPGELQATVLRIQAALANIVSRSEAPPGPSAPTLLEKEMRAAVKAQLDELSPEAQPLAQQAFPPAVVEQILQQFQRPSTRFVLAFDPSSALEEITVPILALFGGKDHQVRFADHAPALAQALERGAHRDATVQLLSGLNHFFQEAETGSPAEVPNIEETLSPRALKVIAAWIHERFSASNPPAERR